jgi:hypothetical protein
MRSLTRAGASVPDAAGHGCVGCSSSFTHSWEFIVATLLLGLLQDRRVVRTWAYSQLQVYDYTVRLGSTEGSGFSELGPRGFF